MITLVSVEPQRKSQASCYKCPTGTLPCAPAPACLPSFPNNCPLTALQQRVSLLNFRFNGPRPGCAFCLESYLPRNLLQSSPYHIKCLFKYQLSEEPPLFPPPQSTPAALARPPPQAHSPHKPTWPCPALSSPVALVIS